MNISKISIAVLVSCIAYANVVRAQHIELDNIQSNVLISDAATWTTATAENVAPSANAMTLSMSFDWNIYNVVNPGGEIDQLFVALGHQEVLLPIVYNGHPGGIPGASGSFSDSFDLTGLSPGTYDLVIARMAALDTNQAIQDYLAGGGWNGKVADLRVVPEPTSVGMLSLGMAILRLRSRRKITR